MALFVNQTEDNDRPSSHLDLIEQLLLSTWHRLCDTIVCYLEGHSPMDHRAPRWIASVARDMAVVRSWVASVTERVSWITRGICIDRMLLARGGEEQDSDS